MKMKICFYLVLLLVTSNAFAELQCSRNGLRILYINGVRTIKGENQITADKISKILEGISKKLDKTNMVTVEGINNDTRNAVNDLHELKAGLEEMRSPGKKSEYWKTMARHEVAMATLPSALRNKVEEAFDQIYKKKYRVNPLTSEINREDFTPLDLYYVLQRYNPGMANIIANAAASEEVIEYLKSKMISSYEGGKYKVIVIAHSQGNVILSNAVGRVVFYDEGENYSNGPLREWFTSVAGYVQLASPSRYPVAVNSKHMRLNVDRVINNAYLVTRETSLPVNYEVITEGPTGVVYADLWDAFNQTVGFNHSIDDVYLSSTLSAKRSSNNSEKLMSKHFQDTIVEVASMLEDNCPIGLKAKGAYCEVVPDRDQGYLANGEVLSYFFTADNPSSRLITLPGSECFTSDDGRTSTGYACYVADHKKMSFNLKFKAIGGDLYNSTLSNPCYKGRILPMNGLVTFAN